MDAARRKELIKEHKPPVHWPGEPLLGGWYTEEEIEEHWEMLGDCAEKMKGMLDKFSEEELSQIWKGIAAEADRLRLEKEPEAEEDCLAAEERDPDGDWEQVASASKKNQNRPARRKTKGRPRRLPI